MSTPLDPKPVVNSSPQIAAGLKKDCLSYSEVIAQSISVIAPSTIPAAVMGLIYARAGNGTWLSFVIGLTGLLFVSANINQFARRSASPGSLFTYIVKGLGPTAGVLSGWSMLLAYMLTGMSTLCGFAIFGQLLLNQSGIYLPVYILAVIGVILACYIAFRDIQLSAKLMLYLEGGSILSILILGIIVWSQHGFAIDHAQFGLENTSASGIAVGVVLVIFGFSGFESSTALGDEAKDPLRTIPQSLIHSTLITGVFFIFMAYVIVFAFRTTGVDLSTTEAPLDILSPATGLPFLGWFINFGTLLSFFACTLACINSSARIFYSMARHGLFHNALGEAHHTNQTPYIAIFISAFLTLLVPILTIESGVTVFSAQGHFGTISSFGFLFVYILVSIAAPFYLSGIEKLRWQDIVYSVIGVALMLLPLVATLGIPGSKLFPVPSYPENLFPLIYIAYMLAGLGWFVIQKLRAPDLAPTMQRELEEIELRFGKADAE